MLAIKSHAQVNAITISNEEEAHNYAYDIGNRTNERTIKEAFKQLSGFSDTLEKVQDERARVDYLFLLLDDVSAAVEKIWDIVDDIVLSTNIKLDDAN